MSVFPPHKFRVSTSSIGLSSPDKMFEKESLDSVRHDGDTTLEPWEIPLEHDRTFRVAISFSRGVQMTWNNPKARSHPSMQESVFWKLLTLEVYEVAMFEFKQKLKKQEKHGKTNMDSKRKVSSALVELDGWPSPVDFHQCHLRWYSLRFHTRPQNNDLMTTMRMGVIHERNKIGAMNKRSTSKPEEIIHFRCALVRPVNDGIFTISTA